MTTRENDKNLGTAQGSAPRETAPIDGFFRDLAMAVSSTDTPPWADWRCVKVREVIARAVAFGAQAAHERQAASGGIAPPLDLHAQVNRVTRLEVINDGGRQFTQWNTQIGLSFQDDGRTLKVFVKGHQPLPHRDDPIEASPSSPDAETGNA